MVAGSRTEGGNQVTSFRVRKIIQSIKEIVGNHSDADIYAALKESDMDPNETTQKLLNQDPFHEVKRRRDKKKELAGYRSFSDSRRHVEHNAQPAKPYPTWDRNARRGYIRNTVIGVNREFRIVRDNRTKQNANEDAKPEAVHNSASTKEQEKSNSSEKSTSGIVDQKQSALHSSEASLLLKSVNKPGNSVPDGPGPVKDCGLSGTLASSPLGKTQTTSTFTSKQAQVEIQDNSKVHSTSTTSSVVGVYSSSSDPVHVPSVVPRSAGTVGAIRRDVGVVGVRRQSSNHSASDLSVSNSSFSVPIVGKEVPSSSESFGQPSVTSKGTQLTSETAVPSMSSSRSFSGSQHSSKVHQQPIGHQKVVQSTKEWKPKSSQKPPIASPSKSETASAVTSSFIGSPNSSNPVDVTNLSEKFTKVNILEDQHVIIPQHLRVPESERTQLTFGSFGTGFDSAKEFLSVPQATESAEQPRDGPSVSTSASVPEGSSGCASSGDQGDTADYQASSSQSDSPSAESEQPPLENDEPLNHQAVESYAEIRLVQTQNLPYSSSHTQQLQTPTSLPNFSAYDSQTSYNVPFLRTVMDDNARVQGLASSTEAVSSHATSSSPPSNVAMAQQQQAVHQQPHLSNMFPQVHFSQFPGFVPYRHVFSPFYGPPVAMPNYPSNPAYPHPSNGSSYVLMPGGSSHVTAGGLKYAPSQYKPVPAGNQAAYGNYTNPTAFTISPPGSVGVATGIDEANRMKYKDNNLYAANPQGEASDIWIQAQRELPNMQSSPYYNLAGQPTHAAAAFMPAAHAGHASFNAAAAAAAQSPHVQYPGLYHPPASPGPHHLVHQSGLAGNIGGVGMAAAAPGPQVGAYQQPQLGHLNWPANF